MSHYILFLLNQSVLYKNNDFHNRNTTCKRYSQCMSFTHLSKCQLRIFFLLERIRKLPFQDLFIVASTHHLRHLFPVSTQEITIISNLDTFTPTKWDLEHNLLHVHRRFLQNCEHLSSSII